MSLETLETIRTRRVCRHFRSELVPEEALWAVLEAARWAPAASNLRLHRYICLTEPEIIGQVRTLTPGIASANPAAVIVVCVDRNLPSFESIEPSYYEYIDAGTAVENMLLAAHALGLGACPATLDSAEAVGTLLNLPDGWTAEMLVLLGYPAEPSTGTGGRPQPRLRVGDLVTWGPFPQVD